MTLHPLPPALEEVRCVTTRTLADLTGIKVQTWANWRAAGTGPSYLKVNGKKIIYPLQKTLAWLESHRIETTGK